MPASGPLEELRLRPIGHVRTGYADPADTPIQTRRNPDEPGRLVVLDQYADALDGLEEFDYAHLICFLHRAWASDGRGTRPFWSGSPATASAPDGSTRSAAAGTSATTPPPTP